MVGTMLTLTPKTRAWLSKRYPRLLVSELKDRIVFRGTIDFNRTYNGVPIRDAYKITLVLLKDGTRPILFEVGSRLQNVYKSHRKQLESMVDLHVYRQGNLCIMAPQTWSLDPGLRQNVKRLFTDYIEPYFYSQSFFEASGCQQWPWKHYSHNANGLVEWYLDHTSTKGAASRTAKEIKKLANRHKQKQAILLIQRAENETSFSFWNPCLCKSGDKYLDCHPLLAKLTHELRT
jgi:hypothetical protein